MPGHIRHANRIAEASFRRWLALWRQTTSELFPPGRAAALQDRAERIAESLQLGIAFHCGDDLLGRQAAG